MRSSRLFPNPSGTEPKEKGRAPEGCGQKESVMSQVAERLGRGNAAAADLDSFRVQSPDKKAALWLTDQVSRAQREVVTQVVELTPALARVLLERNPANRKISGSAVEKYARDIANGTWAFNGEPIIVSREGKLNDGQHRCQAVVEADRPIDVVLVIGTERASRFTIDQGRNKMVADFLSMDGHVDAVALGAAAGYVWQHRENGRLSSQTKFRATKSEIIAMVEANPDIAKALAAIPSKGSDIAGGRSVLAFCYWLFTRRTSELEVDAFIRAITTGENLGSNDPILYARNRLAAMRGRLRANEKAELIIRAWNHHRRREKVKSLPILDGALPVVER